MKGSFQILPIMFLAVAAESAAFAAAPCETAALQAEIDRLAATGGGTLTVGAGVHRTGALFFRPGVNLHLEKDAVLLGSDVAADYPIRETRLGGRTFDYYPAMLNADRCDGFRITGEGVVDGHGLPAWRAYWAAAKAGTLKHDMTTDLVRPRVLYVSNSRGVDVSGVTFRDSKFWTTHFYRCEDLAVHDCAIESRKLEGVLGPSTDAIDLDVVTNAVIRNVRIDVNDDGIALKGGKGPWAHDPARHPENGGNVNVLVEGCTFGPTCHAAVTLGSECFLASNVVVRNCRFVRPYSVLTLKMRPDMEQVYSDVVVMNCTGFAQNGLTVFAWDQYFDLEGRKGPLRSVAAHVTVDCPQVTCPVPRRTIGPADAYSLSDVSALFADVEAVYDPAHPEICRGDLFLPADASDETPVALLIHGGGWSAMKRQDVAGIASYLFGWGYAVYSIDYRLAGKDPWPACGEDCVKAAEFLLSDAFAAKYGFRPKRLTVIGGSAGGHLALWTGLKLGDRAAAIVSISGIGDPQPDCAVHPGRYRTLFGAVPTEGLFGTMDPQRLIRPVPTRILCTHAAEDDVVPIASARNFFDAWTAAGNEGEFYAYSEKDEPNLGGHRIWRKFDDPHRLLAHLETKILGFLKGECQ